MSILLNSSAFLPYETESTAFWVLLAVMVGSLILSYMAEVSPVRSLLLNLLCAGTTFTFLRMGILVMASNPNFL